MGLVVSALGAAFGHAAGHPRMAVLLAVLSLSSMTSLGLMFPILFSFSGELTDMTRNASSPGLQSFSVPGSNDNLATA